MTKTIELRKWPEWFCLYNWS